MFWCLSLDVYGFCNLRANIWFNLSFALRSVLAFIHIGQFFLLYSRQEKKKCPTPTHLLIRQCSSMFLEGQATHLTSESGGGPNRHSKHVKDSFTGSILSVFQKPCVGCMSTKWLHCMGSEAFLQALGLLYILFQSFEQNFPHTNKCDIASGGERGCWFRWFLFFSFLSSLGCCPSVYEAWSNSICSSSS